MLLEKTSYTELNPDEKKQNCQINTYIDLLVANEVFESESETQRDLKKIQKPLIRIPLLIDFSQYINVFCILFYC